MSAAGGPAEAPAVILVAPQMGENIGAAARAMHNCALSDLRLVRPRDGWPNPAAQANAVGAVALIDAARPFDDTAAAVADLHRVYAVTARTRDVNKPVLTPRAAAAEIRAVGAGMRCGLLFGRESSGLDNDDIALADRIVTVPLNPAFTSLNLAQAVLILAYEWFLAGAEAADLPTGLVAPATKGDLVNFFTHLETELDACGFLRPPEKRPAMVRNIRALFQRAGLSDQEVRTLHGIVTGLARHGGKDGGGA